MIAQGVETTVDPLANVAHRLTGRAHVDVLYMPLQARQRRETLVARLASELVHT